MSAKPDSLKYRNTHIPVSVQKSVAQHMERMPGHLKKYQQGGGYIPKHAEKAMSKHMQKSLPGHLKQYADPYIQQHVMWGNSPTSKASPTSSSPSRSTMSNAPNSRQIFSSSGPKQAVAEPSIPPYSEQDNQQSPPQNSNNYDFIMDPPNAGNKSPFFAPGNTKMRIILFALGIIILIILMSVFFSFLNASGNKQKNNLLQVAQTQQEIIRVIDERDNFISDRNLKDKTKTLRAVMVTSQQETIAALGGRGEKLNPKELSKVENPQTDAELESAQEQAKHDEVLDEILLTLLNKYSVQLETVFSEGNASEKEFATDAFNQVDLIYNLGQTTQ